MNFKPNKSPAEINKEGGSGGTYFRDIYSVLVINGTKKVGRI